VCITPDTIETWWFHQLSQVRMEADREKVGRGTRDRERKRLKLSRI